MWLVWAAALRQSNELGLSTHYVCGALVYTTISYGPIDPLSPGHTEYSVQVMTISCQVIDLFFITAMVEEYRRPWEGKQ